MRMILVGLAAAMLAGCGGLVQVEDGGGNGAGPGAGGPAAPGAQGGPSGPAPATPIRPGARRNSRAEIIEDCTADVARSMPAGTDVARFCACAADRMVARVPQQEAARQCAAEQNIRLPGAR